jgi:hypothetical protein
MKPIMAAVVSYSLGLFIITSCSSDIRRPDEAVSRTTERQSAVASIKADTAIYVLVAVNGEKLPYLVADDPGDCREFFRGGRYKLFEEKWVSTESIERTCPPTLAFRTRLPSQHAGFIRHVGDTLFFVSRDSTRGDLNLDRGVFRHDTLVTAGQDYGPQRIYVRSR